MHSSTFNELVDGEGGIIRLNYSVGDLRRRDDKEGEHHTIRILLPYL